MILGGNFPFVPLMPCGIFNQYLGLIAIMHRRELENVPVEATNKIENAQVGSSALTRYTFQEQDGNRIRNGRMRSKS